MHVAGKKPSLFAVTSPVISEPVLVNTNSSGRSSEIRTASTSNTGAVTFPLSQSLQNQVNVGPHVSSDATQVLEECAATKVQAAFRGFLVFLWNKYSLHLLCASSIFIDPVSSSIVKSLGNRCHTHFY